MDEAPLWFYKLEILTVSEVIQYSERLLVDLLPGGTTIPGRGFWKDEDGEIHYDEDQITLVSFVNDLGRIEFVKRVVAIIAASLEEKSIMCVTTSPDGTFEPEFIDTKKTMEREIPDLNRILQWPWPEDLFSLEFIAAFASANHEHSLRLVKSYEERLENLESLGEPTGKHPLSSLVRLTEEARINKAKGSVEGSKKAMGYVKDRLNST